MQRSLVLKRATLRFTTDDLVSCDVFQVYWCLKMETTEMLLVVAWNVAPMSEYKSHAVVKMYREKWVVRQLQKLSTDKRKIITKSSLGICCNG